MGQKATQFVSASSIDSRKTHNLLHGKSIHRIEGVYIFYIYLAGTALIQAQMGYLLMTMVVFSGDNDSIFGINIWGNYPF